jgi:hypothetical protein
MDCQKLNMGALCFIISLSILSLMLSGCSQMLPGLFSTVEDIETQEAITLTVNKEAFQKDTDVKISIEVTNKDPVIVTPAQPSPAPAAK